MGHSLHRASSACSSLVKLNCHLRTLDTNVTEAGWIWIEVRVLFVKPSMYSPARGEAAVPSPWPRSWTKGPASCSSNCNLWQLQCSSW
jgi:hypothetical protein